MKHQAVCINHNTKSIHYKIFDNLTDAAIWLCGIKNEFAKEIYISDFAMLKLITQGNKRDFVYPNIRLYIEEIQQE